MQHTALVYTITEELEVIETTVTVEHELTTIKNVALASYREYLKLNDKTESDKLECYKNSDGEWEITCVTDTSIDVVAIVFVL